MKLLMIGGTEIIFIIILVLLLFGGKKIPELMRGLGQGVKSFKDEVFSILFAPSKSDFILYDILCLISSKINVEALCPGSFEIDFINTQLASQFMTHLSVSMWLGVVAAMPYLIYQLYGFVSPALYDNERRYSYYLIFCSVILYQHGASDKNKRDIRM